MEDKPESRLPEDVPDLSRPELRQMSVQCRLAGDTEGPATRNPGHAMELTSVEALPCGRPAWLTDGQSRRRV